MANRPVDVPDLVKKLRGIMGVTQEQFARELGITFSTVNSWENGKRDPQPYLLQRLLELDQQLIKKKSKR
jgi:transcriptional regulator with XRE-family HTH domain